MIQFTSLAAACSEFKNSSNSELDLTGRLPGPASGNHDSLRLSGSYSGWPRAYSRSVIEGKRQKTRKYPSKKAGVSSNFKFKFNNQDWSGTAASHTLATPFLQACNNSRNLPGLSCSFDADFARQTRDYHYLPVMLLMNFLQLRGTYSSDSGRMWGHCDQSNTCQGCNFCALKVPVNN